MTITGICNKGYLVALLTAFQDGQAQEGATYKQVIQGLQPGKSKIQLNMPDTASA